jgi:DNA-binding response OmpR family regulator
MRVLLVEDDQRVSDAVCAALTRYRIETVCASEGWNVVRHLGRVDAVLLDMGLPDLDGLAVCRMIREVRDIPIIIVSARGEVEDRILGLRAGADDYLVKPYSIGELIARLEAVFRRSRAEHGIDSRSGCVDVDGVRIDLERQVVTVDAREIGLSRKEFQLLRMLALADGSVCPRAQIIAEVWGRSWPGANRTLDVHMATLRTKLGRPELIRTVRGVGYRLTEPAATPVAATT